MNTFGKKILFSIYGESRSPKMTLVIEGINPGTKISKTSIDTELEKRKGHFCFNTERKEKDNYEIESGIVNEITDGKDIVINVYNNKTQRDPNGDYFLRPSHSDFSRIEKYGIDTFTKGGGSSSGRMTVLLTIAGSIFEQIILQQGITVVSHVQSVLDLSEERFNDNNLANYEEKMSKDGFFPTITNSFRDECIKRLEKIKQEKDSAGSIIETAILGVNSGLGSPFFDSLESVISHLMFSIPAIKGIDFGDGFGYAREKGSQAKDEFEVDNFGQIRTKANHNGGINGGISNGAPIIFRTVVKPAPTIGQPLTSIDYVSKKTITKTIDGQNDSFIGNRIIPSIDGMAAYAVLDLLYTEARENHEKQ